MSLHSCGGAGDAAQNAEDEQNLARALATILEHSEQHHQRRGPCACVRIGSVPFGHGDQAHSGKLRQAAAVRHRCKPRTKTPLSVINANTEVIEMTDGESEWTKGIHEQVARMAQLTERLVFLAKMDEGGELDMEDCDLSELAKRAIAEAHHGKALCTTNGVDTITFGIVLRP